MNIRTYKQNHEALGALLTSQSVTTDLQSTVAHQDCLSAMYIEGFSIWVPEALYKLGKVLKTVQMGVTRFILHLTQYD